VRVISDLNVLVSAADIYRSGQWTDFFLLVEEERQRSPG
jgi:hypothetical protein